LASTSSILAAIHEHNEAVGKGVRYRNWCKRCEATSDFKCHELRRRGIRVIVDRTVQVLSMIVARWTCSRCRQRFTDLPDFVLPYRRFALPSLLPLAAEYLEDEGKSYRAIVAPNKVVTGYTTPLGQAKIDERALNATTLWRFLLFMGLQTVALQEGIKLLNEHDPLATPHRFVGFVAPQKYRSELRCEILSRARRLLDLIDRWNRYFPQPFFPRFATIPRAP